MKLVLEDVARFRAACDGRVVIFLFNFVGQRVQLWTKVIQRACAPCYVGFFCGPEAVSQVGIGMRSTCVRTYVGIVSHGTQAASRVLGYPSRTTGARCP